MPFWAPDIGIDLGTDQVHLYVRGRGIVISEPSLVVLDRESRHTVRAVGDEAAFLLGRSPDRLSPVWPIRNGQVADFDVAELMLRYFVRKAIGVSYVGKPRVIVSVPCNLDDVNRKALSEAVRFAAGSRHVFLIEKPFAAAIGTGLPVYDPIGNLVVDIGAGTTDVAVISLGGLVRGISMEAIFMGISQSRNPNLAAVFYRLGLIESYGTGIRKIIRLYQGFTPAPAFQSAEGAFTAELFNRNSTEKDREKTAGTDPESVSEMSALEQAKATVFARAKAQGQISRKEAEEILQVGPTKAYKVLKTLCEEGLLSQRKNGNQTVYMPVSLT